MLRSQMILCLALLCLSSRAIELTVGQPYVSFMHTPNWNDHDKSVEEYFEFRVDNTIEDVDLVFISKGLSPNSDPDIYISSVNEEPTAENAEVVCNSYGLDVCTIRSSKLKPDTTYFVTVSCLSHCRYQISVLYESEMYMGMNDYRRFHFSRDDVQIIKIYVPAVNDSMSYLEIKATVINVLDLEEPFKMLLNKGNKVPQSNKFDMIGLDAFTGDKIIVLDYQSPTSLGLSEGNYTLLLEASKGCEMEMTTRVYGQRRDIKLFELVEDTVLIENVRYYKLNLTESPEYENLYKESNLVFQLIPFSGKPDLYVNPRKEPQLLNSYKWNNQDGQREGIIVTQLDQDSSTQVYYIAIYGGFASSTYTFTVQADSTVNTRLRMNDPMKGQILPNELKNYKFIVSGKSARNVTVTVKNIIGDTSVAVKYCGAARHMPTCLVTEGDTSDLSSSRKNFDATKLFTFATAPGDKQIVFTYDPALCSLDKSKKPQYFCLYTLGIFTTLYSSQDMNNENIFEITIKSQHEHVTLRENTPEKDFIQMGEYKYYKFTVVSSDEVLYFIDSKIRRLHFQLTPLQGDAQMYVSRTELFPTFEKHDEESVLNVIRFENSLNGLQNGTYYISVYGWSSGLYMITPLAIRNFGDFRDSGALPFQYILLSEGEQQEGFIDNGKALYKIDLTSISYTGNHAKQNITIVIDPLQGNYQICGADHPARDMNTDGQWMHKTQNFLQIQDDDEKYPEILYLHVYPVNNNNGTQNFRISYKLSSTVKTLYVGQPFKELIGEGERSLFKLMVQSDETLYITKHVVSAYSDDVEIYYSLDEKNRYPNHQFHDGQIFQESSTLISGQDIPSCSIDNVWSVCTIFLQAHARVSSFYSISVNKQGNVIRLVEGIPSTIFIKDDNELTKLYYVPSTNQPITVLVSSPSMLPVVFASITRTPLDANTTAVEYPSSDSHDYSVYSLTPTASLIIREKDLKSSTLLLSVQLVAIGSKFAELPDQTYFTIVATSDVVQLTASTPIKSHLEPKSIHYYSFTNYDDQNATVVVSVTPLSDVAPKIVVSFGADQRPTLDRYDWISSNNSTEIVISRTTNSKVNESMLGTFVVGVYADSNCTFSIQYQVGSFKLVKLMRGTPSTVSLRQGEIQYFDYYNYDKNNLKFLLSIDSGKATIFATAYGDETELREKINEPLSSFPFMLKVDGALEKVVIKSDDKDLYCSNCHYLLAITAMTDITFSMVVTDQYSAVILQNNLILRDHIEAGDVNMYHYYGTNDFDLHMTIFSGSLSVKASPNMIINQANDPSTEVKTMNSKDSSQFLTWRLSFPTVPPQTASAINNGVYTFSVFGENSNYSIQCTSVGDKQKMKFGQAQRFHLSPQETKELSFHIKEKVQDKSLTISMNVPGIPTYRAVKPEVNMKAQLTPSDETSYMKQQPYKDLWSNDQQIMKYYVQPGRFKLEIKNTYEKPINVTLTISLGDTHVLMHNTKLIDVEAVGQIRTWQIFVSQPASLLVNVVACRGMVNLYVGDDVDQLTNGHYKQEFKHNQERQVQGVIPVTQPGEVYIATKPTQGQRMGDKIEAVYKINYEELPANATVPFDWFTPEYQGVLEWEYDALEEKLRINYPKLLCRDNCASKDFTDVQYTYTLYLTGTDYETNFFDQCTVSEFDPDTAYNLLMATNYTAQEHRIMQNLRYNVHLKQIPVKAYIQFNIQATVYVKEGDSTYPLHFYYNPNKVDERLLLGANRGGFPLYLVLIMFAVVVAALIGIVILYRRNRILKSVLKYELSDVRNIARPGPSSSDGGVEMKHTNLMDDKL